MCSMNSLWFLLIRIKFYLFNPLYFGSFFVFKCSLRFIFIVCRQKDFQQIFSYYQNHEIFPFYLIISILYVFFYWPELINYRYKLFRFQKKINIIKHTYVEVSWYWTLSIHHLPFSYITIGHHIDSKFCPTKLNEMIQITFWSFRHSLVS